MMKLLRRRSPSWTSLFISCFLIAVVIEPTQAKELTEIQSVQELDRFNVRYYETNWPLIFPQAPFTLQGTISVEF